MSWPRPHTLLSSLREPRSGGGLLQIAALALLMVGALVLGFGIGFHGRAMVEGLTAAQVPAHSRQAPEQSNATPPVSITPKASALHSEMMRGFAEYQRIQLKAVEEEEPAARALLPEGISEAPSHANLPSPKPKPARRAPPPNATFTPHEYWDAPGYIAR